MRSIVYLIAALLVALSPACDNPTDPLEEELALHVVEVRPGGADEPTFVIEYRVENRGAEAVYLSPRCGDSLRPVIYERQEQDWARIGGGLCTTDLNMSPWRLGAGESLAGRVGWNEEGVYQLRIEMEGSAGESGWISSAGYRLE